MEQECPDCKLPLKGGKIIPTRKGRLIRMYCPKCFKFIWIDEKTGQRVIR